MKVNESEKKILPNRIVINPNNTVGEFTCKITSAADDSAAQIEESDKVKIISDNTFKSRMMKFERMINTNDSKEDDYTTISGSPKIKVKGVNSNPNQEKTHYQADDAVSKHARRKTISIPPSMVLSMTHLEDSRLSF